jgi:lipopolysaccharide biosynthesis protein
LKGNIRVVAVYLPQFHPFPENDKWWGKGFTEWRNVTKARPLFPGHYQPHLPADLGFYDLRLEAIRSAQAEMAQMYGISGFCYYHYWFNGRRLLKEPLDAMLESGKPNFPFMYCWANENWNRRWDGDENEVLIKQEYSDRDDIDHITYLCKHVFNDPRYIRVNGKPFFAIYRPLLFPEIKPTLQRWRDIAGKLGIELYLAYMQGFNFREAPEELGFDAAIEFQPDFYTKTDLCRGSLKERTLDKLKMKESAYKSNRIFDYAAYVEVQKGFSAPEYKLYRSVTPMWDNTARRKSGAFILKGSSPEIYEGWLREVVKRFTPYSAEENFVFINAWNEWAEGNHLEPCLQWGTKYLEATKRAIDINEA